MRGDGFFILKYSNYLFASDMDDYLRWLIDFDVENPATKTQMSDLLVEVPQVRSLYSKLVPEAVAHSDFWQRYYYR